MHRLFRQQLDGASGRSEFVVVHNLDIRGFSDWSLGVDSAQSALYIKKVYARLIDEYFPDASFIKPTGDGLLVVRSFGENELREVLTKAVASAVQIVNAFGSIVDDEPLINFSVPKNVGIGISRGAASCLASEKRTLDYSGRPLNLASRLMDLARPQGVVFDASFGADLIPEELAAIFKERNVYLKGVSPDEALAVYCWPGDMHIPTANLRPIGEQKWETNSTTVTFRELEQSDSQYFRFPLDPEPLPNTTLECLVRHDAVTPGKRRSKTRTTHFSHPITRAESGGKKYGRFDQQLLAKRLQENGVGPTWPVLVEVTYRSS